MRQISHLQTRALESSTAVARVARLRRWRPSDRIRSLPPRRQSAAHAPNRRRPARRRPGGVASDARDAGQAEHPGAEVLSVSLPLDVTDLVDLVDQQRTLRAQLARLYYIYIILYYIIYIS